MVIRTRLHYMKKMCLTTVVDKGYFCYIPLFIYCAKKAYPEYDIKIFTRGDYEPSRENRGYVVKVLNDDYSDNVYCTAALRFLQGDDTLKDYEYVLNTDIDIMTTKETPDIIEQHVTHMNNNKLMCYSNGEINGAMTGVHFVTKDWWEATRDSRHKILQEYIKGATPTKGSDERNLSRIVVESGLTVPSLPILWNFHGLHLGKYRDGKKEVQAGEDSVYWELMKDKIFLNLVEENKCELLNTVFINTRRTFDNSFKC
jgi:hypothetical protein